ncbi:unnamed protein product [Brassica oleracea]
MTHVSGEPLDYQKKKKKKKIWNNSREIYGDPMENNNRKVSLRLVLAPHRKAW